MKIICDTNIWYNFYKNHDLSNSLNSVTLILTFNTINELSRSYNMLHKPILYKGVAKTILNIADEYIDLTPFQHIKSLDTDNWEPKERRGKQSLKLLREISKTPDIVLKKAVKNHNQELNNILVDDHIGIQRGTEIINKAVKEVRKNVSKFPKNKYRELNLLNETKELISFMVNEGIGSQLSKNFDWSQIELFVSVLDCYFKDLTLSGNSKISPNDWIDLFNLAYVNKGMRYWTFEKKWNAIINNRIGDLSYYNFRPLADT